MKFSVITLFPEIIEANFKEGVVANARKKGILKIESINPRQFATDVHKTVDDRPFGGGDGMVMLPDVLEKSFRSIEISPNSKDWRRHVIYLSPQGKVFNHEMAKAWSQNFDEVVFLCGRYAGVDQRVMNQYVDQEVSIGDYVLSGGEIAAAVIIDTVSRQLPKVLGHEQSASLDSFSDGLLEAPLFTRPRIALGQSVPEVLCGGNHKAIEEWRRDLSILVTMKKRPDLLVGVSEQDLQKAKARWKTLSEDEKTSLGFAAWKPS